MDSFKRLIAVGDGTQSRERRFADILNLVRVCQATEVEGGLVNAWKFLIAIDPMAESLPADGLYRAIHAIMQGSYALSKQYEFDINVRDLDARLSRDDVIAGIERVTCGLVKQEHFTFVLGGDAIPFVVDFQAWEHLGITQKEAKNLIVAGPNGAREMLARLQRRPLERAAPARAERRPVPPPYAAGTLRGAGLLTDQRAAAAPPPRTSTELDVLSSTSNLEKAIWLIRAFRERGALDIATIRKIPRVNLTDAEVQVLINYLPDVMKAFARSSIQGGPIEVYPPALYHPLSTNEQNRLLGVLFSLLDGLAYRLDKSSGIVVVNADCLQDRGIGRANLLAIIRMDGDWRPELARVSRPIVKTDSTSVAETLRTSRLVGRELVGSVIRTEPRPMADNLPNVMERQYLIVSVPEVRDSVHANVRVIDFRRRDARPGSSVTIRLTGEVRDGFAEARFVRWGTGETRPESVVVAARDAVPAPRERRITSAARPDHSQIRANLNRAGESLLGGKYTRALVSAAIVGIMEHPDLVEACDRLRDGVGAILSEALLIICRRATSKNPAQIAREVQAILRVDRNRKDILRGWA